ncbi:MAG TPA: FkbM family methyltransferase [Hyphomicrobiales bacterium]|nr:FkbM family methyltransferase [Hyphomicrobiales bacterium]
MNGNTAAAGIGADEEIATIAGVAIALDPKVMSPKMMEVLRAARYERQEARQLVNHLQPGDRVVELGAGVGFLSSLAHLQGKAAHIAAYEANPHLIPTIRQTHALNGAAAEVHNAIIVPSPEVTSLPFYIRNDFWASSLLPRPPNFIEEVTVPAIPFAEMLERHNPTFLIVDIEGGEADLFRTVPLTGVKKVLIELHQRVIGRVGMKRVFDFFSQRDFHYDQMGSEGSVVLFSHVLR